MTQRIGWAAALALVAALATGSGGASAARTVDWPQFKFTPGLTGYNQFESILDTGNVASLAQDWHTLVAGPTQLDVANSPVLADGSLYIANLGGATCAPGCTPDTSYLYRLDASTGEVVWRKALGTDQVNSTAAVDGGVVYIGAENAVHAFSTDTGDALWTTTLGGQPQPALTISAGLVYTGASDGKVYALSAADGGIRWSAQTGDGISSPVAAAGGRVYARSNDGDLYAFGARNGTLLWHIPQTADHGGATAVGGTIYLVDAGLLEARRASNGSLIWSVPQAGSDVHSTPVVGAGMVILGAVNGPQVSAYDAATGRQLWAAEFDGEVLGSPVLANGVVYVITDNGILHFVSATSGDALGGWSGPVESAAGTTPAVVNGRVFMALTDGEVTMLAPS